jgi:hypothetical protein
MQSLQTVNQDAYRRMFSFDILQSLQTVNQDAYWRMFSFDILQSLRTVNQEAYRRMFSFDILHSLQSVNQDAYRRMFSFDILQSLVLRRRRSLHFWDGAAGSTGSCRGLAPRRSGSPAQTHQYCQVYCDDSSSVPLLTILKPSGHYMYRTVVTVCTARFNIHKFYVLPTQCFYVFCVDIKQTAIISLYTLANWFL